MQHIGVDLGGRQSQVCVRDAQGEIVWEEKLDTRSLKRFFQAQPKSRIILETCSEAFRVADWVLECGHEVRVVPATLVRSLGVGARRTKNDRIDARILSEVSSRIDLPSVHIPAEVARERRTMCGMREQLIGTRTGLVNCVLGWKRTQLLKMRLGRANHPAQKNSRRSDSASRRSSRLRRAAVDRHRGTQRADQRSRQGAQRAGKERSGVPTLDVCAGRWSRNQHALCGGTGRPYALSKRTLCRGISGADTRRKLQRRAKTATRHHQGRARHGAQQLGASGMDAAAHSTARSHVPVGRADREASRKVHRDGGASAQTGGRVVRVVARRHFLQFQSQKGATKRSLAGTQKTPATFAVDQRKPINGCPEAVSALISLQASSESCSRPSPRDCAPPTDLHLCATTSANSRLRQPVLGFHSSKEATTANSRLRQPDLDFLVNTQAAEQKLPVKTGRGITLFWTDRPPHSRD